MQHVNEIGRYGSLPGLNFATEAHDPAMPSSVAVRVLDYPIKTHVCHPDVTSLPTVRVVECKNMNPARDYVRLSRRRSNAECFDYLAFERRRLVIHRQTSTKHLVAITI